MWDIVACQIQKVQMMQTEELKFKMGGSQPVGAIYLIWQDLRRKHGLHKNPQTAKQLIYHETDVKLKFKQPYYDNLKYRENTIHLKKDEKKIKLSDNVPRHIGNLQMMKALVVMLQLGSS